MPGSFARGWGPAGNDKCPLTKIRPYLWARPPHIDLTDQAPIALDEGAKKPPSLVWRPCFQTASLLAGACLPAHWPLTNRGSPAGPHWTPPCASLALLIPRPGVVCPWAIPPPATRWRLASCLRRDLRLRSAAGPRRSPRHLSGQARDRPSTGLHHHACGRSCSSAGGSPGLERPLANEQQRRPHAGPALPLQPRRRRGPRPAGRRRPARSFILTAPPRATSRGSIRRAGSALASASPAASLSSCRRGLRPRSPIPYPRPAGFPARRVPGFFFVRKLAGPPGWGRDPPPPPGWGGAGVLPRARGPL